MRITTKKGDGGMTSLLSDGAVFKDDPRVELEGALDELCSFLGLAKSFAKNRNLKNQLKGFQETLFVVGAEVAAGPSGAGKLKQRIGVSDVSLLEEAIEACEKKRDPRECVFCLPGANPLSAVLDVARTLARRAERRAVTVFKKKLIRNASILVYLNRLSDLLYLLARASEKG